jgi:hypothetical protein
MKAEGASEALVTTFEAMWRNTQEYHGLNSQRYLEHNSLTGPGFTVNR